MDKRLKLPSKIPLIGIVLIFIISLTMIALAVDTSPPFLNITSPENISYSTSTVWINFTANETLDFCGFSLNGTANDTRICLQTQFNDSLTEKNITFTESGSQLFYIQLLRNSTLTLVDLNLTGYPLRGIYDNWNFSVSSEGTGPTGVYFNGTHFWVVDTVNDRVYRYLENGTYDNWNFDVSVQDDAPTDVFYNGTHFWVVGNTNNRVYRYTFDGTYDNWNFDTSTQATSPRGVYFNGTYFWVVNVGIAGNGRAVSRYLEDGTYDNWFFDVSSEDAGPRGVIFNGTYFWISGDITNKIYRYTSDGIYDNWNFDVSSEDDTPRGLTYNESHFWIIGGENNKVYRYLDYSFTKNIEIDTGNDGNIDFSLPGTELKQNTAFLDKFNDSSIDKNTSFTSSGSQLLHIQIPLNSTISIATLNFSGFYLNFFDDFDDAVFDGNLWDRVGSTTDLLKLSNESNGIYNLTAQITGSFGHTPVVWHSLSTDPTINPFEFNENLTFDMRMKTSISAFGPLLGNCLIHGSFITFGGADIDDCESVEIAVGIGVNDSLVIFRQNLTGAQSHDSGDITFTIQNNGTNMYNVFIDDVYNDTYVGVHDANLTFTTGEEIDVSATQLYQIIIDNFDDNTHLTNIKIDTGNDDYNETFFDELNETNSPEKVDLNITAIQNYIDNVCTTRLCDIPINISTDTAGILQTNKMDIQYTFNPSGINITPIKEFLSSCLMDDIGFCNLSINISSDTPGIIEFSDVKMKFQNSSLKITLSDGSYNITIWGNDSSGNLNNSDYIYFTIDATPDIEFISPTPSNDTTISKANVEINVSIIDLNILNEAKFNWNTTNYTLYDDSLVLMFNFDNLSALGENDTHTFDISKYGNNGTVDGSVFTTSGKYGGAFQFDGVDDYINVSDDDSLDFGTGNWTISLWMNAKPRAIDDPTIFLAKQDVNEFHGYFFNLLASGQISIELDAEPFFAGFLAEGKYDDNKYHHITLVRSGIDFILYIDAIQRGSATIDISSNFTNNGSLEIGSSTVNNAYFNGTLDEVRIYNTSFDLDGVRELFYANLNKVTESQWYLFVNQSNLTDGTYTYQGFASDISKNENSTEKRTITVAVPPTITSESINVTFFNGTQSVNLTFTVTDDNLDICFGEFTLEDSTVTNITGTLSGDICSVIGTVNQIGDFSFKPYANDTAGNTNNGSTKEGVRVNLTLGEFTQNTDSTTIINGTAYITRNMTKDNSIGSFDATGVSVILSDRSGWTCADKITSISIDAGTTDTQNYVINCTKEKIMQGIFETTTQTYTRWANNINWSIDIIWNNTDEDVSYINVTWSKSLPTDASSIRGYINNIEYTDTQLFNKTTTDVHLTWNLSILPFAQLDPNITYQTPQLTIVEGSVTQGSAEIDKKTPLNRTDAVTNPSTVSYTNVDVQLSIPGDTAFAQVEVYVGSNKCPQTDSCSSITINSTSNYTNFTANFTAGQERSYRLELNLSKVNYTVSNESIGNDWFGYLNTSKNATTLTNVAANRTSNESIKTVTFELFTGGEWVDKTNDAAYSFTEIDLDSNGTTDKVTWIIPSLTGLKQYRIRGSQGIPINFTTDKVISNPPVIPFKNIEWIWTVTFYNSNAESQNFTKKIYPPVDSQNIQKDNISVQTFWDINGRYILIEDTIAGDSNITHLVTFITPPTSTTILSLSPSVFFVDEPGLIKINVSIINHASQNITNIEKSIEIPYGENLFLCRGLVENCTVAEAIDIKSIVSGSYTIKEALLKPFETKEYTIIYEIPTVISEIKPSFREIINNTFRRVTPLITTSVSTIPLISVKIELDDIDCDNVTSIIDTEGFDYVWDCGSTIIELGSYDVGTVKSLNINQRETEEVRDLTVPQITDFLNMFIFEMDIELPLIGRPYRVWHGILTLIIILLIYVSVKFDFKSRFKKSKVSIKDSFKSLEDLGKLPVEFHHFYTF